MFSDKKCPNCGMKNPKDAPTCSRCGAQFELRTPKILKVAKEYDDAIRLEPDSAEAYYKRGFFYQNQNLVEQAMDDFDRAIRIDPQFARAYANRAYAHLNRKEYDMAIADCTKAINLNPEDAVTYLNRGIAYMLNGDKNKAMSDLEKSTTLSDDPRLVSKAKRHMRQLSK